jgi:hypothetical protein
MFKIKLRSLLMAIACFLISQTVSLQNAAAQTTVQDATAIAYQYAPRKQKSGPHPDFILPSIDGDNDIQLSNYRGKKVLLLHFASW